MFGDRPETGEYAGWVTLAVPAFLPEILIDNTRSERVMDKLGLRFEFQTTVPANGQPVAVHAITRHEFSLHDGIDAN